MISSEKQASLQQRMQSLHIFDDDLIEKFVHGSGKGGQKVNKTASCVYLKHFPSGIEIKCQAQRSREINRFFARRELCDRIEEKIKGKKSKRQQAQEKIRRQKRRRSRRQKNKMLDEKSKHSEKKVRRQKPEAD